MKLKVIGYRDFFKKWHFLHDQGWYITKESEYGVSVLASVPFSKVKIWTEDPLTPLSSEAGMTKLIKFYPWVAPYLDDLYAIPVYFINGDGRVTLGNPQKIYT